MANAEGGKPGGILASISDHVPYVRRYARALIGDGKEGDGLVRKVLEDLAAGNATLPAQLNPKIALYNLFQTEWLRQIALGNLEAPGDREAPLGRSAYLLSRLEGFSDAGAAEILGIDLKEFDRQLSVILQTIDSEHADILIIEDEPVIAADIASLVAAMGHRVIAVTATHADAVSAARSERAELILADIQLADGSSGVDAVQEILRMYEVPVIFVTAFPERLLSGERPEPAFLITKPFNPATLKAAISQALFFSLGREQHVNSSERLLHSRVADTPQAPASTKPINRTDKVQSDPFKSKRELVAESDAAAFSPDTSILTVSYKESRLTLTEALPITRLDIAEIEGLRVSALAAARHIAGRPEGHNHPGLQRRIGEVIAGLAEPFTRTTSIVFAAEAHAFERVRARIDGDLTGDYPADLEGLSAQLQNLSARFDNWIATHPRIADPALKEEAEAALLEIAATLANQPSEVVEPTLSQNLTRILDAYSVSPDDRLMHMIGAYVSEMIKATPRWIHERRVGIGNQLNEAVDKLGAGLVIAVICTVSITGLGVLAAAYPSLFSFVPALVRFIGEVAKSGG